MRTLTMLSLVASVVLVPLVGRAQPQKLATRDMNDLNWMEFRKLVPSRVDMVLVTVGTMEPHGVINNGADNTAPIAIARALAEDVNALVAPNIPYGVTGDMAPYPGALHVPEDVFRSYVHAVLDGMAKNGFRRVVVINGHGGPQTAVLQALLREVAFEHGIETLLINWWSLCSDETQAVFGEDGGHAGNNETAFIQAINPKLVHKEMYSGKDMATAFPTPGTWSATPFPSSIGLYKPGQGYPKDFDQKKADEYYKKVVNKEGALIKDTVKKWNMAGFR
ncbi:MAG TPA: creatininase family protein [Polyangia bacterium]|nr:creatininase family protein [Polyangia bacterium]